MTDAAWIAAASVAAALLSFLGVLFSARAARNTKDSDQVRDDVAELRRMFVDHLRDHAA